MADPVQFTSETLRAIKRLDDAPVALRVSFARAVDLENQFTVSHIQQRYLSRSGPETLGVRSGRLWQSLWASKARVVGNVLVSSIGTNVVYMRPHEYGFDGVVQVRTFTRRARSADVWRHARVQAVLHPDGRITRRAGKSSRIASGIQVVKAHSRHAHYAERAPIRRGIADRKQAYEVALEKAAIAYLKGGTP